jgi:hypothetical protein
MESCRIDLALPVFGIRRNQVRIVHGIAKEDDGLGGEICRFAPLWRRQKSSEQIFQAAASNQIVSHWI